MSKPVVRSFLSLALALVLAPLGGCSASSSDAGGGAGKSGAGGSAGSTGGSGGSAGAGGGASGTNGGGDGGGSGAPSAGAGGSPSTGGSGGATDANGPPVDPPATDAASGEAGVDPGPAPDAALGQALRIYWVDVEGGASTVIVTPAGQVLVVDTGFPGARDAGRITKLLREEVKTERIDYLITTHFDGDHVGGAARLADTFDVTRFVDRGSGDAQGYAAAAQGKRMGVRPGDKLALMGDVELVFVVGNGTVIETPLAGNEPNPHCAGRTAGGRQMNEDGRSLGYRLKWGNFEFLDLADLLGGFQHDLACPVNRIGQIDLLQVPRHGQNGSSEPQLMNALAPIVAVSNNSATKGADAASFVNIKNIPGLQGLWQSHRKSSDGVPEDQIANPTGDPAHFIRATVDANGAFTITNARNGFSKSYQAR